MNKFAIGVDLGGTSLRIAAVESTGKILEKITTGTEVARGRERVIDEMCAAVRSLALKFRPSEDLAGIGVGVPGIIDMATGMLRESPNLPGWQDYPVREEIETRLGTTVVLENDANAAALGENWLGAAAGVEDMCMLTLGTGVGGGLVLGGRIWHGMTGMAAEIGHINVDPEGVPCGCGSRGCLEQYASATAVKRMALEAIATGQAPGLARAMSQDPEFSSKVVHQMASEGDESARQIFHRVGHALGIGLADLINIFNLPMYVLGGGVAAAWDAFAPAMIETVRSYSYIYRVTTPGENESGAVRPKAKAERTMITRALLGSDAGLIGAARLPLLAADRRLARQEVERT
ncbi:MAG TPA: ROK family protein [Candidatus Angelobacter sp.]|nr:ROK family protein [Candidatus Angelobacter sp.]